MLIFFCITQFYIEEIKIWRIKPKSLATINSEDVIRHGKKVWVGVGNCGKVARKSMEEITRGAILVVSLCRLISASLFCLWWEECHLLEQGGFFLIGNLCPKFKYKEQSPYIYKRKRARFHHQLPLHAPNQLIWGISFGLPCCKETQGCSMMLLDGWRVMCLHLSHKAPSFVLSHSWSLLPSWPFILEDAKSDLL